jgi:methyltransferase OMS1
MATPRVAALVAGGAVSFCGGLAAVTLLAAPKAGHPLPRLTEVDRLRIFSEGANAFDAHVDKAERALGVGMGARRAALIGKARGDVVEVCAGGGRNNALYDARVVTSLTLTDFAPGALALAAQRPCHSSNLVPKVLVADAHALPLPDASADAVVDSFGLCSLHSPEAALAEWMRVLRPGGRLLLLEHGRSRWFPPVNWLLDRGARGHERQWGCDWSLDIEALVARALPGLVVESVSRHHLGTTVEIVLRKKGGAEASSSGGTSESVASGKGAGRPL